MSNDDKSSEPPGAVSNQNAEEAEAPHEEEQDGLDRRQPSDAGKRQGEEDEGAAGEGTQSTGHPESAG